MGNYLVSQHVAPSPHINGTECYVHSPYSAAYKVTNSGESRFPVPVRLSREMAASQLTRGRVQAKVIRIVSPLYPL